MKLGERIRSARLAKAMSLSALAESSRLSKGFLSQIENGASMPSIASLRKLGIALDVSLSQLVDDAPNVYMRKIVEPPAISVARAATISGVTSMLPQLSVMAGSTVAYIEFTPSEWLRGEATHGDHATRAIFLVVEGAIYMGHGNQSVQLLHGDFATITLSARYTVICTSVSAKVLLLMPAGEKLPKVVRTGELPRPVSQSALDRPTGPYRLVEMRAARRQATRVG